MATSTAADNLDSFATIRIDEMAPRTAAPAEAPRSTAAPQAEPMGSARGSWWNRWRLPWSSRGQETDAPADVADALRGIAPEPGEPYSMVRLDGLLERLAIDNDGYRDNMDRLGPVAATRLRTQLAARGLRMATQIAGPMRPNLTDMVGLCHAASAPMPTRSTLSICLYMLVWLAQADGAVSSSDLEAIDRWLMDYDRKASGSAPFLADAQATVRWLASRRLVFTRKRKLRVARLVRFAHRREQFVRVLLQMASDAGQASPRRTERLHTIYALIGLNPAEIHADIHRMSLAPSTLRVKDMAAATAKAQQLLGEVFGNDGQEETPEAAAPDPDAWLRDILAALESREELGGGEFADLCRTYTPAASRLTPGAVLEKLNDMAFDIAGEAAVEDDGSTYLINNEAIRQCLGHLAGKL